MPGANPATSTLQSPSITYAANGVYSATLIATNASGTNSVVKSITVTPSPVVSAISSSSTMCTGQTVTLTASGAVTYTWMPGNITGNPIASSPTVSTTYSVTGTATTNCKNISMVTVSVSTCAGINSANTFAGQLEIIPNPNNGQFIIKTNVTESFDISIYNGIGQLIKFIPQNRSDINIDLSNYGKGMYNLLFNVNGNYKNLKVIIE